MTDRSLAFSSLFPAVDGVASDPGLSLSLASAQSLGLPPKLCCSFYSSGSSARRLTSLDISSAHAFPVLAVVRHPPRNLSTTLRHRRLRFTEQSLLLWMWMWQVG